MIFQNEYEKQLYDRPQEAGIRKALELCADVLKHVQIAYNCPESPIINLARERATAALLVGDKRRSGSVDSAPLAQSIEPPTQSLADLEQRFMKVLDGWEEDSSSPAAVSALQFALGCVRDAMTSSSLTSKEAK